ncbi:hypothetical protein CF70_028200 [Cupriavidus sp. SK-3]|uniref:hypothetical protein n=1 Tax=Cupriavidus sp. SK-3 TaxID=1470558 RepID=UPI000452EDBE|nr:hypothetical protein [Cupriavidus sp. SK-3]KDP88839.1 hypothetical protein CF70_028200 [Cupriavidus sp. SK-3]
MAEKVGGWILVESKGGYRRLARYAIEDEGPLNIRFVRAGTVQEGTGADSDRIGQPKTRKLSYHATGQVHLDHRPGESVFMEPLGRITGLNLFAVYRVPSVGRLDEHDEALSPSDLVLACPEQSVPTQFLFGIGPCTTSAPGTWGSISLEGLFTLSVAMAPEAPDYPEHLKIYFSIFLWKGLFEQLPIQEDLAHAEFRQKLDASQGLVVSPATPAAAKGGC